MAMIDLRYADIVITDGSSNYIEIKVADGVVNYTETRQIDFVKSRGVLDTVRQNEDVPVDVDFIFIWEFITSASGESVTIEDALKHRNGAASWVSACSDPAAPFSVNVQITYTPNCHSVDKEIILFNQFNYESLAHQLKDSTVAIKGKCNVTQAAVSRVAQ